MKLEQSPSFLHLTYQICCLCTLSVRHLLRIEFLSNNNLLKDKSNIFKIFFHLGTLFVLIKYFDTIHILSTITT